jgi:hypothetical protein
MIAANAVERSAWTHAAAIPAGAVETAKVVVMPFS